MITASAKGSTYKVHNLVNRAQWFGKTWLLQIAVGYDSINFVVEADNEQDAIDEFTDSKYGHMIKTDELCIACEQRDYDNCQCTFGGNYSERIDLDYVYISKCKVNYFVKRDSNE